MKFKIMSILLSLTFTAFVHSETTNQKELSRNTLMGNLQTDMTNDSLPMEGYKLVWSDEFDGKALDLTKWDYRGLGRRRDAINAKDAVTLDGKGHLLFTTKRIGDEYHTAMIGTQGKFETTFGYFECRVRFQTQIGHWSAFWLQSPTLGNPANDSRKAGTEIDIFEYLRKRNDKIQHTLHWDGYGNNHKSAVKVIDVPRLMEGWHTVGLLWTPTHYAFYVDGKETWQTDKGLSHRPQYMILSLEVGEWAGEISEAKLPDHFYVDYVRVYKRISSKPHKECSSIIFDTDLDSDVDDVGALAVLHALANKGEAKILGVIVTSDDMHSPLCADAINTYFQHPDIPIGVNKKAKLRSFSRYTKGIAEEYPHDLQSYGNADDATSLYRKILASQPDNSVIIVTVGHLTNLKNLLLSEADTHSPLGGITLVRKKAKLWSCMGGKYPKGKEPNFYRPDPGSTSVCVNRWPKQVVFSGAEIGNPIKTGGENLRKHAPLQSPVRRAYELYNQFRGRSSWDQTAVLYAVRGNSDWWSVHRQGHNHAFSDGSNEWRSSPDKDHGYLVEKTSPGELAKIIDELMIQQ